MPAHVTPIRDLRVDYGVPARHGYLDLIRLITTKLSKRRGPGDVQRARYLYLLMHWLKLVRQRTSSDHRSKKSTTPGTTPDDHPRTQTHAVLLDRPSNAT
jgi:hypothetical protein